MHKPAFAACFDWALQAKLMLFLIASVILID